MPTFPTLYLPLSLPFSSSSKLEFQGTGGWLWTECQKAASSLCELNPLEGSPGQPQSPGRSPSAVSPSWVMEGSILGLPTYLSFSLSCVILNVFPLQSLFGTQGATPVPRVLGAGASALWPVPSCSRLRELSPKFPRALGLQFGGRTRPRAHPPLHPLQRREHPATPGGGLTLRGEVVGHLRSVAGVGAGRRQQQHRPGRVHPCGHPRRLRQEPWGWGSAWPRLPGATVASRPLCLLPGSTDIT